MDTECPLKYFFEAVAKPNLGNLNSWAHELRKEKEDMSSFSSGQLNQLGDKLESVGWTAKDVTLLGQAGRDRLIGIRDSLRGADFVEAIMSGQTELWLAPGQDVWFANGEDILNHLTTTGLLARCADFTDLAAIQAKGAGFFRTYFSVKCLAGWRGSRSMGVSCLYDMGNRLELTYMPIASPWDSGIPALLRR